MDKERYVEEMKNPQVESWLSVLRTYRTMFHFLDTRLQQAGCSIPRFQVLIVLCLEDQETPVNIARRLSVSRANVSTFLKRLIADGLIQKNTIPESRRSTYSLSPKGQSYLKEIFPEHISHIKEVMEVFDPKHLRAMEKSVKRVHELEGSNER